MLDLYWERRPEDQSAHCSGGDGELTSLLADSPPVDEEGLDGGGRQDQGEGEEEEAGEGHHHTAGGQGRHLELRHCRV